MSWKKVNLLEYSGYDVFMDEYGFCRPNINNISINGLNTSELYVYNEDYKQYVRYSFGHDADSLEKIFKTEFYKRKKTNQPYYGYRQDTLTVDQAVAVKVSKVVISLQTHFYASLGNNGSGIRQEHVEDTIELKNANDIKKYTCWYSEHANTSSFKMVILPETKVDDEFYLVSVGKVRVTKLIEYPNKNNAVCEVVDIEGKNHIINIDSEVYYLPYGKIPDEYEVLNKSLNELQLSPYLVRHNEPNHIYNVYWNTIADASCYHVVLYKFIEAKNRRRILQIADYEVDRNTCYLSLDKLAGRDFVFKVKAEDRNGNIIAESRGIASGSPQYFNR